MPVLASVNRSLICVIVPLIETKPVPLPPVIVTPLSPAATVITPSPTVNVATAPLPASSTSVTLKPVPSIDKLVCSMVFKAVAGPPTTGASFVSLSVMVDVATLLLFVPSLATKVITRAVVSGSCSMLS